MVHQLDQGRPGGQPGHVRCEHQRVGGGRDPAQQRTGRLALHGRQRGDQHRGQPHADRRAAHQRHGVGRHRPQCHRESQQDDAGRREAPRPQVAQGGAAEQADRDRTGALHGVEHAGVRGGVPEAVDDGVHHRPVQAGAQHRGAARQDQGAQHGVRPQVPHALGGPPPTAAGGLRGLLLSHPQQRVQPRGQHERRRVQECDTRAAVCRVEARARQRGQKLHALGGGHAQAVEVTQHGRVHGGRHERRLGRVVDDARRAVHEQHRVQQPQVARGVDAHEGEQQGAQEHVHADQQRSAASAVGQGAQQRSRQGRQPHGEHAQRGQAVRAGQVLDPHAGRQPQGGGAEAGDHHAGEVQPGVTVAQDARHGPGRLGRHTWSSWL